MVPLRVEREHRGQVNLRWEAQVILEATGLGIVVRVVEVGMVGQGVGALLQPDLGEAVKFNLRMNPWIVMIVYVIILYIFTRQTQNTTISLATPKKCGSPGFLASIRVKYFLRVIVGFMDECLVFLFMDNFAEVGCVYSTTPKPAGPLCQPSNLYSNGSSTFAYRNHMLRQTKTSASNQA